MWRFNPADYKVGDTLFVADGHWSYRNVTRYIVTKITPSGQVVAKQGNREIRVTPRGSIVGSSTWTRASVVSPEQAADIELEFREKNRWSEIRRYGEAIAIAAQKQDHDALMLSIQLVTGLANEIAPTQSPNTQVKP